LTDNAMTQTDWEVLNTRFLLIQEEITSLQNNLSTVADESESEQDLSLLVDKISRIEQEQEKIVKPHLKRLIAVVKQLQQNE
jgi:hypothetical protein